MKDVRYQVVLNEEMANKVDVMAKQMCMNRSEFIRMCIAQSIYGFNMSNTIGANILREMAPELLKVVDGESEQ